MIKPLKIATKDLENINIRDAIELIENRQSSHSTTQPRIVDTSRTTRNFTNQG